MLRWVVVKTGYLLTIGEGEDEVVNVEMGLGVFSDEVERKAAAKVTPYLIAIAPPRESYGVQEKNIATCRSYYLV